MIPKMPDEFKGQIRQKGGGNMSWEEYAKIILGNKRVIELKKEYNLCTKKYTWGRYKNFINRLKKECKEAERCDSNER